MSMFVGVIRCGGQRSTLSVILLVVSTVFFEIASHTSLEHTEKPRLSDQ